MMWYDTGLPANESRPWSVVDVEGISVGVVFVDGRWWAAQDRCSHAGCAFSTDGDLQGTVMVCSCGSEFDVRTGEVLMPPAVDPITVYGTRVSWGTIEVEM